MAEGGGASLEPLLLVEWTHPHLGCVSNISPGHTGVLCFHGEGAGTGNSHRKRTGPRNGEPSGEPKQLES